MSLIERTLGAAKNARDAVTRVTRDPQALREEARDLPLRVFQLAVRGVGQALMVTDKLRKRADKLRETVADPVADRFGRGDDRDSQPAGDAPNDAGRPADRAKPQRKRATPDEEPAPAPKASAAKKPAAKTPAGKKTTTKARAAKAPAVKSPATKAPAAKKPAGTTSAAKAADALPIPDYDARTLASLRARLRGLSSDDVNRLLAYEQTHADRGDVVAMYRRRIAKLAEH